MRTALALLLLAAPAPAQDIEDPGPFSVGWEDRTFAGSTSCQLFGGPLEGRLYYPALGAGQGATPDPSGGPFPLAGFLHGFTNSPATHDEICTHLASWGFVVASIGTETGLAATMQCEAMDTAAMLNAVDALSSTPGDPLEGMVWAGDWYAAGHSMGGGALFYLIEDEPRVRAVVPLAPYRGPLLGGSQGGSQNLLDWDGAVYLVAGEVDAIAPPSDAMAYYAEAESARRSVLELVLGAGHSGSTDSPRNDEPLPALEQQRLNRRLLAGFLRAEAYGAEDLHVDLIGEGASVEPLEYEADCPDPPIWAASSELAALQLRLGTAGVPGFDTLMLWALATGDVPTPFGALGLDLALGGILWQLPLGGSGIVELGFALPAGLAGLPVHFQSLAVDSGGGMLSQTTTFLLP